MIKICYNPSYYRIFTKTNVRLLIFGSWILSLVIVLPPAFGWYGDYQVFESTKPSGKYYCGLANPDNLPFSPSALLYSIGFFVPFIAILVSYWKIYSRVREHRNHFKSHNSDARSLKLFKTIMIIFIGFLICYLPNLIFRGYVKYTTKYAYLRQLIKLLMFCNTVFNPFVYFVMNNEYRKALFQMMDPILKRLNIHLEPVKTSSTVDSDQHTAGTPLDQSDQIHPVNPLRMVPVNASGAQPENPVSKSSSA